MLLWLSTVREARVLLIGGGDHSTDTSSDITRASLQKWKKILTLQHAVAAPERAPFLVTAAEHHGHVVGLDFFSLTLSCLSEIDIGLAPDVGTNYSISPKIQEIYLLKAHPLSLC